jgi:hypothetical protein
MKDAQIFKGTGSRQISDNDDSSADSILAKKQGDDRKYYAIHRTVTVKMSLHGSCRGIEGQGTP